MQHSPLYYTTPGGIYDAGQRNQVCFTYQYTDQRTGLEKCVLKWCDNL